ncbi:glycosyltransferase family 2 protein [Actinotignum sp. GS-2025a]|uniref:glycosyltransferase family 2 protein n=1 Tax=Actinotignum sp. GS-2025a TaxID=3427274 RepID=UPI003F44A816
MRLDIMLPFWGNPDYLFQTVESVLAQDSDEWKLTVVDDCYPDESVPDYFAQLHDERITYIRNETNRGITENYETCLKLATAEYMMFMGCDDIMEPNFVSTIQAAIAAHPTIDIIQPGVRPIDAQGTVISPLGDRIKTSLRKRSTRMGNVISGEGAAAVLLTGDWLYWPSLVFRTETIRATPFRPGFPLIQDLAIVVDMLAAGASMLVEPTVCFRYRRHDSSASASKLLDGTRFAGERRYFTLAAEEMKRRGWTKAQRAARLHATSRLYAATLLPRALKERSSTGVRTLLRHLLGS